MEITKHPQPVKTKGCSPELRAATPLPRATFTKKKKKKKKKILTSREQEAHLLD